MNSVDSGKAPSLGYRTPGNWMRANLSTQGYCLNDDERRRLAVGLRFSTGRCLLLAITALALESPRMSSWRCRSDEGRRSVCLRPGEQLRHHITTHYDRRSQ